jgi:hypothetical protein
LGPKKINHIRIDEKIHAAIAMKKDTFLATLLSAHPEYFDSILSNTDEFNVQIIYTQIDRASGNVPKFTNYYYNVDGGKYFYPASTVKLPIAALALQKLNELNVPGLDRNSTMITEAGFENQTAVLNDPTTEDGRPTVSNYIKKILLVSDNDAYNRLYEFLGQEYINANLHRMGYDSAQILHRLSLAMNEEQNRHTNPVKFYSRSGKLLYEQGLVKSNLQFHNREDFLGRGYMRGSELVNEPFDFSIKNRLSLPNLHSIVQSIVFPESLVQAKRFKVTKDDYAFLQKFMSMLPGESAAPQYDTSYTDAYVKFLMFGGDGNIDDTAIRIFNKPGDAYGFLTDAAYIVDFKNGVEFMLSATIYCNSDGVFNDDRYDYETIGFPFLKNLGQVIYDYEMKRKKKNKPDLSAFKFDYKNQN